MIGLFNIIVAVGTWDDPDPRKAGLEVSLFTNIMMVLTFLFLILDIQVYKSFVASSSCGSNTYDY